MTTRLAGRYRLEAEVARGGMAVVWRAVDEVLDRQVAAKVLHDHLAANEVFRERFRIEALAAARLAHPNIISVYDSGDASGKPFIVMEYLPGGNLKDRLKKGPMDSAEAAAIGAQISAALSYAHREGIIHRDIKPANILFAENGSIKVADFGIAKAAFAPTDLTDTGAVLGTVRYLAPEQVQGHEPGPKADLYSLGLVLYEAVTGRAAFEGTSDLATATARIGKIPTAPRDLRPGVSRELDSAIMCALSPTPEGRFEDAHSFERALAKIAGPIQSRPPAAQRQTVPPRQTRSAAQKDSSFVKNELRWLGPTAIIVILAIGLILGVPALREKAGDVLAPVTGGGGTEAISVSTGGTYDPRPGDGTENDAAVRFAFDKDSATKWSTVNYASKDLGGLKEGVGIYVDLGEPKELAELRVMSPSSGWQASVRTSDDASAWSTPSNSEEMESDHTFEVDGNHRYWMIWITGLTRTEGGGTVANPFSAAINEIEPRA